MIPLGPPSGAALSLLELGRGPGGSPCAGQVDQLTREVLLKSATNDFAGGSVFLGGSVIECPADLRREPDGGQHLEQGASGVGVEVEHVGIVQVVVDGERVGDGVADVVGAAAVFECRVSNLQESIV